MRRADGRHLGIAALALAAAFTAPLAVAQDYPVENAPVGTLPVGKRPVETAQVPPTDATVEPQTSTQDAGAAPAQADVGQAGNVAAEPAPIPAPADAGIDASGAPVVGPAPGDATSVQPGPATADASVGVASTEPARAAAVVDAVPAAPAEQSSAPPAVIGSAADAAIVPLGNADASAPAPFLIDPSGNPPERAGPVAPFSLLGTEIAVGTRADLGWRVGESFDGNAVSTPVVVLHGAKPGPRLCLTAAVHGDELNGIEVVRRIVNEVDPTTLGGTVIGVPVVNLLGFSRGTRYLPDRRDLNRFFPGTPGGSAAARIAHSLFNQIVVHCDALVDFHTGSFDRANLPQVRGDLTEPAVLAFTRGFGATPVLHSPGARGMLRLAASFRGIPAVTFEVGAPQRIEPEQIEVAVQAISTLMHKMGMSSSFRLWAEPQATYYESKWVRANDGGMLISTVRLGDRVREGQRLGKVVDPLRNLEQEILSPFRGRVIGLALNQVVLPGFAAYHIGIETSEQGAVEEALAPAPGMDEIERMEGDEMEPAPVGEGEPRSEPDAPMPPD